MGFGLRVWPPLVISPYHPPATPGRTRHTGSVLPTAALRVKGSDWHWMHGVFFPLQESAFLLMKSDVF